MAHPQSYLCAPKNPMQILFNSTTFHLPFRFPIKTSNNPPKPKKAIKLKFSFHKSKKKNFGLIKHFPSAKNPGPLLNTPISAPPPFLKNSKRKETPPLLAPELPLFQLTPFFKFFFLLLLPSHSQASLQYGYGNLA